MNCQNILSAAALTKIIFQLTHCILYFCDFVSSCFHFHITPKTFYVSWTLGASVIYCSILQAYRVSQVKVSESKHVLQ